ncbi:hypothetical protein KC340_g7366 [Hortaea werneckii]|nr:hypothetical protein KC342_g1392 [Hortaea werneckii]KAI7097473.1 hypothetical protein KC339_g9661 [Hortaea werneckii]KAI7238524.1 hypothetical protein KC365_g4420 [Hortaea werneckii]KAI7321485.1 hypothetical protein KC340_g7366 [Hortaea werneckii]KAI7401205.1 hypothetical protein KC328_g3254 [Hortaea werneckii]
MANMAREIDDDQLAICEGDTLSPGETTDEENFQPFRFFGLPPEIRDWIYELVLVPEFPIDFAPLVRGRSYESFWEDSTPYEETHGWHFDRYRKVKAALMLLRTNKQINSEATPIFYGQPFRFSNQSGWLALYHWMESIGKDKWDMIKDITICHPTFMGFPKYERHIVDSYGGFALSLGMRPLYEDYFEVQRDHWERGINKRIDTYHEDGDCGGPEIDPVEMISDLPALRHLRLILTCTQREDLWWNCDLETPGTHPILDVETTAGLSIQAISLVPYDSSDPSNIIDTAAEDFGTIKDYPPDSRFKKVVGLQNKVWSDEAIEIRQAYADMRDNNVELVGMYYDAHCHFPVFPNKECANKDLCDYLRGFHFGRFDHKSVDGVCCGTKDERRDDRLYFSV